ncbi:LacI family DNA-binding transcriptional regulator [Actinomyces sp.]|uniref:LacI family DNA-binding transcriptional regulator n=1 Tax=Actinomyces sp. TaxID=29317 RepID=UPI00289E908D|nr:LacI family DNA-binding transcriptional regulator [Actinomyces sp.]
MVEQRQLPTMIDVANHAGVSLKTVSRVVNGELGAGPETRERVKRSIRELGYRRNGAAAELRSGRSGLVGLVIGDVSEPFQSTLTRSIEDQVVEQGMLLVTVSTEASRRRTQDALRHLMVRRPDGLIIFPSPESSDEYRQVLETDAKTVFVDRPAGDFPHDLARSDHRGGARLGARRLIKRGHRRIAYLGDPQDLFTGTERRQGYVDALEDAGIPYDPRLVHLQDPELPGAGEAFLAMLRLPDPPTAVLTGNSLTTIALLRCEGFDSKLTAHVAFDDILLADVLRSPLTVVAQDIAGVGREAAALLRRRLDGDESPAETIVLPLELRVRKSDWTLDVINRRRSRLAG